ncbi:MAG: hypothetical protein M1319_03250 [Chloroflexi bacterium]|nr:hypothetical protein [Chloroflexota bacterium]
MVSGEGKANSIDTIGKISSDLARPVLAPGKNTAEAADGIRETATRSATWRVLDYVSPLVAVALVIMLWAISLPGINIRAMNDYGLVSVLPPAILIAMALLTLSFSLLVTRPRVPAFILVAHVIALIFIVHGTTAMLYELPRYSWTYKHIGVVDYIMRNGSVNPAIDIYHNWPGFFALGAFFTTITGLPSPLSYAGWAPVFFNILYFVPLLFLFRTFSTDRRVVWLGVWFFYLASWVGQDYFAPQALSYFFYIVILAIVVAWFRVARRPAGSSLVPLIRGINGTNMPVGSPTPPSPPYPGGTLGSPPDKGDLGGSVPNQSFTPPSPSCQGGTISILFRRFLDRPYIDEAPAVAGAPLQRFGIMAIIILVFFVVVSSHQLTPYAIIAAMVSIAIFRVCSARLLPVLMVIIAGAWALYVAATYMNGNIQWIIQSIGELLSNVDTNVADLSQASAGRVFTAWVSRGLTATLWGLALLGAIRRFRLGHRDLPILLLAIAPFPLIATQSYGGEMIFRIFLFTLPPMAFLAASAFIPSLGQAISPRTSAALALTSLALLGGLLFAYYGKESVNFFTNNEMQAVEFVHKTAPNGSLLVVLSSNLPMKYRDYEMFTYHSLTDNLDFNRGQVWIGGQPPAGQAGVAGRTANRISYITYLMSDLKYHGAYLVVTRSEEAYINLLDIMPKEDLTSLEQALANSANFRLIMSNSDAQVYVLADDSQGAANQ